MKYIWEEKDIICGRIFCKDKTLERKGEFTGWDAKHTKKIGFVGGSSTYSPRNKISGLPVSGVAIIAMTDGMVGAAMNKVEMINYLNTNNYVPMPHDIFLKVMDTLKGCYDS